jgi:protein SCO1/2
MENVRRQRSGGALVALLAMVALAGCGSSSSHSASDPGSGGGQLQGLVMAPAKPAPALALRNYTGQPVSLSSLHGKAVLVTFVYTHCVDVCPLIVANLAAARRQLGSEAKHLAILAVTVDPRRDTPAAIRSFLAARDATGSMDYLLGSMPALRRTWSAWDVAVTVDTKHATTGHTALVYGIGANGRVMVVLPADFKPSQVVHDVPLLAGA